MKKIIFFAIVALALNLRADDEFRNGCSDWAVNQALLKIWLEQPELFFRLEINPQFVACEKVEPMRTPVRIEFIERGNTFKTIHTSKDGYIYHVVTPFRNNGSFFYQVRKNVYGDNTTEISLTSDGKCILEKKQATVYGPNYSQKEIDIEMCAGFVQAKQMQEQLKECPVKDETLSIGHNVYGVFKRTLRLTRECLCYVEEYVSTVYGRNLTKEFAPFNRCMPEIH